MNITVYTKPSCVQCDATKRHLKKLNLDFKTVDITEDQASFDMIVGMGFQAAPVVITDTTSWSGYQPDKINGLVDL